MSGSSRKEGSVIVKQIYKYICMLSYYHVVFLFIFYFYLKRKGKQQKSIKSITSNIIYFIPVIYFR